MRLLLPLMADKPRTMRRVRRHEVDLAAEFGEQLLEEWRDRERVSLRGQLQAIALVGAGPAIGYFALGLGAVQLFLLLAYDALFTVIADYVRYRAAPHAVVNQVAAVDDDRRTLAVMRAALARGPRSSLLIRDDRIDPRLLLRGLLFTEPYVYGIVLWAATLATTLYQFGRLPVAFWLLLVGTALVHVLEALLTARRARVDDRLEPLLAPRGVDLVILAGGTAFGLALLGAVVDATGIDLPPDGFIGLYFGILAAMALAMIGVSLWLIRARRRTLGRFLRMMRRQAARETG